MGNFSHAADAGFGDGIPPATLKQVPNILELGLTDRGSKRDKSKLAEKGWAFPAEDVDLCWGNEDNEKEGRSYAIQAVQAPITVFAFTDALAFMADMETSIMAVTRMDDMFSETPIGEWCRENCPSAQCYRGFTKRFSNVRGMVDAAVSEASGETQLLFAGHGLGGGVAQLTALYAYLILPEELRDNVSIITYGSPAVFDRTAATAFDRIFPRERFRRVEMKGDLMPSLRLKENRFAHAGLRIEMDGGYGKPWFEGGDARRVREELAHELEQYKAASNKTL